MIPRHIPNQIDGVDDGEGAERLPKLSPHNGSVLWTFTRSTGQHVEAALAVACAAQPTWGELPGVGRGAVLHRICNLLEQRRAEIAEVVARETGKSPKDALGETDGAIALGRFYAGEGQRLYGRTTTSGVAHKHCMTVREPLGVAGLIAAANTPIANVAWKVFPALVCGNAAILKAAEDTPATAWLFAAIAREAGLPAGVLSVVQGLGAEAGAALVAADLDLISFTGSTAVGRAIAAAAGPRLVRLSLELGGKNPLVVCDDADLDKAVHWTVLSAFSNAGQRCAAASRIIVFDAVYDEFRRRLLERTARLRVGPCDDDDFGPVINLRQLNAMLATIDRAVEGGAQVSAGGHRLDDAAHGDGFYMAPTVLENVDPAAELSRSELFGPITALYRVTDFEAAIRLANDSPYGLTACIHTRDINRAMVFTRRAQSGVVVVNAGTFGSEPHMPFGGVKQSGNGSREPGTEALDIYSNLKDVYLVIDPTVCG